MAVFMSSPSSHMLRFAALLSLLVCVACQGNAVGERPPEQGDSGSSGSAGSGSAGSGSAGSGSAGSGSAGSGSAGSGSAG